MAPSALPGSATVAEAAIADGDLAALAGMAGPSHNCTVTIRPCYTKGCPP
jgi:hypothetical protein